MVEVPDHFKTQISEWSKFFGHKCICNLWVSDFSVAVLDLLKSGPGYDRN